MSRVCNKTLKRIFVKIFVKVYSVGLIIGTKIFFKPLVRYN